MKHFPVISLVLSVLFFLFIVLTNALNSYLWFRILILLSVTFSVISFVTMIFFRKSHKPVTNLLLGFISILFGVTGSLWYGIVASIR